MKKIAILSAFLLCLLQASYAQDKKSRPVFEAGEILVLRDQMQFDDDYIQSAQPYQNSITGIATGNQNPKRKSELILKEGIATLKVTDENGIIHKGDAITSSSLKGTGMKATQPGMIVGFALEDANASAGTVKIRVQVQYSKP